MSALRATQSHAKAAYGEGLCGAYDGLSPATGTQRAHRRTKLATHGIAYGSAVRKSCYLANFIQNPSERV